MTYALQFFLFCLIAGNFVALVIFVVRPLVCDAFYEASRKPVRHEAVILQFRPRTKGRFHVR